MKKTLFLSICSLILLLLATQCEPVVFPREFPRVVTLPVVINGNSVMASAEFLYRNEDAIQEHGFLWGEFDNAELGVSEGESFSGDPGEAGFNYTITDDLRSGKSYYLWAYVITADHVVYGNPERFVAP